MKPVPPAENDYLAMLGTVVDHLVGADDASRAAAVAHLRQADPEAVRVLCDALFLRARSSRQPTVVRAAVASLAGLGMCGVFRACDLAVGARSVAARAAARGVLREAAASLPPAEWAGLKLRLRIALATARDPEAVLATAEVMYALATDVGGREGEQVPRNGESYAPGCEASGATGSGSGPGRSTNGAADD